MNSPEKNMITDWLKENGNPEIEIQVLNEVVDKLVEERDTLLKQRDEFAIEFARWIIQNQEIENTSSWSENTAKYYLEQFKKEKGL